MGELFVCVMGRYSDIVGRKGDERGVWSFALVITINFVWRIDVDLNLRSRMGFGFLLFLKMGVLPLQLQ